MASKAPSGKDALQLWRRAVSTLDPKARETLESFRVLLVDDDYDVRTAVQMHLRASLQEVEVLAVEDGESALALMQSIPVDVVLSDYQMPGMDGLELLGRVRELRPNAVRLMFTSRADMALAQKAVNDEHVHSFLSKPVDPDVLVRQVADALLQVLRDRLRDRLAAAQDKALRDVIGLLREGRPAA